MFLWQKRLCFTCPHHINVCAKSVLMTGTSVLHLSLMTGMPVLICSYDRNVCASLVTHERNACAHLFLWQKLLCFFCLNDIISKNLFLWQERLCYTYHQWQEWMCSFILMTGTFVLHLSPMTGMNVLIYSYDRNFCATLVTNDRNECAHLFLWQDVCDELVLMTEMSVGQHLTSWQEHLGHLISFNKNDRSTMFLLYVGNRRWYA